MIAALKTAQLHKIPGWTETSRTQQTIAALTLALLIIGTAMRRSAT